MDADGQNQTNLTNSPGGDLAGDFSPDGSKIVFISTRDGNFEVYLMDADGQNQTNLTNNAADDERPVFSPDGTKIAFLSTRDGTAQVHVMDPDGQNPTNLTNREGFDVAWDWGVAVPPETTIDSGPSGNTNDPTPTFSFSSSDSEASFECKVDSDDYAACTSPQTVAQLADGSHTFNVRATDSFGIVDPTPASRAFMVRTAEVSVTGSTLQVTAAAGAKDNLRITKPSASTLRVTDVPSGAYTGSGVHVGAGCTRTGDYSANCNAAGITLVRVASADQDDKVVNATPVKSLLNGGAANDTLTGGSANDTLTGSTGADVLRGLGGNDQLLVRDGISDTTINCGGGTADKAVLDPLPEDPDSSVSACETKTRPGPYVALGDSLSNGVGASSPATTGFVARLFADYQASLDVDELVNEAENGETSGALRTGGQLSRGLADINAGSDTKAVTIEVGAIDALFGTCAGHWHQPDDCDFRENFRAILTRLDVALQNDPGAEEFSTMAYYNPPNATIGGSPADRERNLLGTNLKIGCSDAGAQLGLNDVIYQEAGRLGIPVANPYPAFKQHGQAYMSQTDPMRIHPNDAGYGAIAQAFRNASGLCG